MTKDLIAALLVVAGVGVAAAQSGAEEPAAQTFETAGWQVPIDLPNVLRFDAALDRRPMDCARVLGARLEGRDHAVRHRSAPVHTPRRSSKQVPAPAENLAPTDPAWMPSAS
jgi:hypothetical protein